MELLPGVTKEDYNDYVLYCIDNLSAELQQEIRDRLVAVCHGVDQAQSTSKLYSYKQTVKDFIKRYQTKKTSSPERQKGMIGELLIHVILEIEGRFTTASPFFNMEECSFKKGYDIALFEKNTNKLWIAEVKSGEIQKSQNTPSSAMVGLINTAKNDLKERLNDPNTMLWLNALNAARVSMSDSSYQKEAVIKLLEQCGNDAVDGTITSNTFNVVLSSALFYPTTERVQPIKIAQKYAKVIAEGLFNKVFIVAVQKGTFEAVYDFLEREASDAI